MEALITNVIGTFDVAGTFFRPTVARFAEDTNAWSTFERFDEAIELRGAKGAVILLEAWREIVTRKEPEGGLKVVRKTSL